MILSPNEIAYVARQHWQDKGLTGWKDELGVPYSHWEISVAVALAESGGNTEIMGRSTTGSNIGNRDHGLWQISNKWHQLRGDGSPGRLLLAGARWRSPVVNARLAFEVWDESRRSGKDGWIPWSVYTSGSFKTYLPDARIAVLAPWAPLSEWGELTYDAVDGISADLNELREEVKIVDDNNIGALNRLTEAHKTAASNILAAVNQPRDIKLVVAPSE